MSLTTVYLGRLLANGFNKYIYKLLKKYGWLQVWIFWTLLSVGVGAFCFFVLASDEPADYRSGLKGWQIALIIDEILYFLFLVYLMLYAIRCWQERYRKYGAIAVPISSEKKAIRYLLATVMVIAQIILLAHLFSDESYYTLVKFSTSGKWVIFIVSVVLLLLCTIPALRAIFDTNRPKSYGAYYFLLVLFCLLCGMLNPDACRGFISTMNIPESLETVLTDSVEISEASVGVTYTTSNHVRNYYKTTRIRFWHGYKYYSLDDNEELLKMLPNYNKANTCVDFYMHCKQVSRYKIYAGMAEMSYVKGKLGYPYVIGFSASDSTNTLPPDPEFERRSEERKKAGDEILELMLKSLEKVEKTEDN